MSGQRRLRPYFIRQYYHTVCRICGWEDAYPRHMYLEAKRGLDIHMAGHRELAKAGVEEQWAIRR